MSQHNANTSLESSVSTLNHFVTSFSLLTGIHDESDGLLKHRLLFARLPYSVHFRAEMSLEYIYITRHGVGSPKAFFLSF